MSHSLRNRLLPMLMLVPSVIVGSNVLMAAPAHAAVACDPLQMGAKIMPGTPRFEVVTFKLTNCTATAQTVILSGIRHAPAGYSTSGFNFGDSQPFPIPARGRTTVMHGAPAPTCKGVYKVTGDSEVSATTEGMVLDADMTSYTIR
jgi:hypothetical protein